MPRFFPLPEAEIGWSFYLTGYALLALLALYDIYEVCLPKICIKIIS